MTKETKGGFQKTFITGLAIMIPVFVTIAILMFLFNLLDNWLAPLVNQLLQWVGLPLPVGWKRIPGLGILATLLLVFLTGLFSTNYVGRRLIDVGHRLMNTIPVVKNVYGGISQLVKAFSSAGATPFKTVVLVEFPKPNVWTLGFVSSDASELMTQVTGISGLVNVFIPAAPIPSQGLYVLVSKQDLRILPISTEEGFKMLATLGLVQKPGAELPVGEIPVEPMRLPASESEKGSVSGRERNA